MKFKPIFWLLCFSMLCGFAWAQMPSGQWYVIHQDMVKPSMVAEYEAALHDFVDLVKADQTSMPHFHFYTSLSEDFTYTFAVPVSNMADVDAINSDFKAMLSGTSGAKFGDAMSRGNAATNSIREWVVGEAKELSYTPAAPRLKPDEMKFFHTEFFYFQPGKEKEAMAIAKAFADLSKRKNIPDSYRIFMPIMGPDMPAVIVRTGARDAADFYAASMKNREAMGAEGQALYKRAFAITRRHESVNSFSRPDLSDPPPIPASK